MTCNLLKKNKYKILYRLIDDIYFNTGFKQVKKVATVNTNINKQLFISQKKNKPELAKKLPRKKYTVQKNEKNTPKTG